MIVNPFHPKNNFTSTMTLKIIKKRYLIGSTFFTLNLRTLLPLARTTQHSRRDDLKWKDIVDGLLLPPQQVHERYDTIWPLETLQRKLPKADFPKCHARVPENSVCQARASLLQHGKFTPPASPDAHFGHAGRTVRQQYTRTIFTHIEETPITQTSLH